jgi:hypothetical protein
MNRILVLLTTTLLLGLRLLAHSDAEIGPNGGRIVEFSQNESLHGEVTLKDGFFHVALLDHQMKPVAIGTQVLNVAGGDRKAPQKPTVTVKDGHFVFPVLKGDEYPLVLQLRPTANAKPITARFTYDSAVCGKCKQQEWLCGCKH